MNKGIPKSTQHAIVSSRQAMANTNDQPLEGELVPKKSLKEVGDEIIRNIEHLVDRMTR